MACIPTGGPRVLMTILIGCMIGFVAWAMAQGIVRLLHFHIATVQGFVTRGDYGTLWGFQFGWALAWGLVATLLVVVWHPPAGGSGVPETIGYLNGVDIKEIISVRTFIVKFLSCLCINASGLPVGAEGPIIHLGAMIGGGLSQGRSRIFLQSCGGDVWKRFRLSDYRRDFTTAGVAGGVSAAYGAPLGALIFAMEEVSSSWGPHLTVLIFMAGLCSALTAQMLNSAVAENFGSLQHTSLVDKAQAGPSNVLTLGIFPVAVLVGLVGGAAATGWTMLHATCFRLRSKFVTKFPKRRVAEVVVLLLLYPSACLGLLLHDQCSPVRDAFSANVKSRLLQGACPDGWYSPTSSLLLSTLGDRLVLLLSTDSLGLFPARALLIALALFWSVSLVATGSAVCPGMTMPALLQGAFIGRLIGVLLAQQNLAPADPGVVALIGAAAFFSGVSRQVLSVSIILLEIGGDVAYLFPLMLCSTVAKALADSASHSLYHTLIELKCIPFLPAELTVKHQHLIFVRDVMSDDVVTLPMVVKVRDLVQFLAHAKNTHHGFPVVVSRRTLREHARRRTKRMHDLAQAQDSSSSLNSSSSYSSRFKNSVNSLISKTHQDRPRVTADLFSFSDVEMSEKKTLAPPCSNPLVHVLEARGSSAAPDNLSLEFEDELVFGGLITRAQLNILMQFPSVFQDDQTTCDLSVKGAKILSLDRYLKMQDDLYFKSKKDQGIADSDMDKYLDLTPYVDPSAVSVTEDSTISMAYTLFKSVMLRHLVVLNAFGNVVGLLTRHDLLGHRITERYRARQGLSISVQ